MWGNAKEWNSGLAKAPHGVMAWHGFPVSVVHINPRA